MARRAAYLFCFNPASVFYSAVYSESLFAFLTFSGALSLALNRPNRAAIAFFASSAARSNGAQKCRACFAAFFCVLHFAVHACLLTNRAAAQAC